MIESKNSQSLIEIYHLLLKRYGDAQWWPAKTPYEVMVGAILTQNTAWTNVEKAICNFGDKLLPEVVASSSEEEIAQIIRPAGFFRQKAKYLQAMTAWYKQYEYCPDTVCKYPLAKLRPQLLQVRGIGEETADSILLYAFGFATFVVDAYTRRLCGRYGVDVGRSYAEIKASFEKAIKPSASLYNNYHALIVLNAKEHCKVKPRCESCPLAGACKRVGG